MQDAWNDRLSEYLDDELDPGEKTELERHVAGCARCRTDLDALRAVIARAQTLRDLPPSSDLWPGVAERIGAASSPADTRTPRRVSFTMPQLVAAALALMVLSGGMVWLARLGGTRTDFPPVAADTEVVRPASVADPTHEQAIADLQQALEAGRSRLDPRTRQALEADLRAADVAIAQCRDALAAYPANVYFAACLTGARERKLALLRDAIAAIDRSR